MSSDLVPAGSSPDRFTDSFQHEDLVDIGPGYAHRGRRTAGDAGAPYGLAALLNQTEWWRPQAGQPVRVVEMTDTHRLHTARFVLNRASAVLMMHPETTKATPLFRALLTVAPALPLPGAPGWDDMLERAKHWSTCPRNRNLAASACSSECEPKREAWDRARELMVDYDGDAAGVNGL